MYADTAINMPAIFISNGAAIGIAIILLFSKSKRIRYVNFDEKLFSIMCVLVVNLAFLETLGFCLDGKIYPFSHLIFLILNSFIFCLTSIFSFIWTCYVDYKLFEDIKRIKRIYPFIAIPLVILCVMSISNIFTDVFFTVTNENIYIRLPFIFLIVAFIYSYLTYGAVLALKYRKKVGKYLFMPVLKFLFPIYIGSIIQLFCYGISLIWLSIALGLTSLYINLQNEDSYIDTLTNLYNRKYLFGYMFNTIKHLKKSYYISGIMIDVNSFKIINDTYGHLEGDKILKDVGKILVRAVEDNGIVGRYGGDEFIIIIKSNNNQILSDIENNINKLVDNYNSTNNLPYKLSLSVGTYSNLENENIDDFLKNLDCSMYKQKREYYKLTSDGT